MSDEGHIYCCERCGGIFESVKTEAFCEECRKSLSTPTARVLTYQHTCTRCGTEYVSKSATGKYCSVCRRIVANEQKARWAYEQEAKYGKPEPPKRKAKKGNAGIAEIVKKATAMGLSYGEYVSKFGG